MVDKPRTVLVIGKTGQLARELARSPWPAGWQASFAGRDAIDLACPDAAAACVEAAAPEMVVNAAAYTAVDKAESEPGLADAVNAVAPGAIAAACARMNVPFVTVSTDYVFDGAKRGAYVESDPVGPIGAYGRSKERGERLVREAHGRHLILRTSWVFGALGNNFVRTMLRLGAERKTLKVVADQRGKPTAAADLAAGVIAAAAGLAGDASLAGTYHLANEGPTSWHEFARAIFDGAKTRGAAVPDEVLPIATAEYPTPARRPMNSELDCELFARRFGLRQRDWRLALKDVLDELLT
ncbi:MAG: dTDP-4-dehydrorhamnose reductase [Alphaproteobacteria bacterium]|nr:dTDP-4-dehydrorhamnose reductase [Alphaproteobacteria bacterium]